MPACRRGGRAKNQHRSHGKVARWVLPAWAWAQDWDLRIGCKVWELENINRGGTPLSSPGWGYGSVGESLSSAISTVYA